MNGEELSTDEISSRDQNSDYRSGVVRQWKPVTLTVPFLASVIAFSIAIIVLLQFLLYRSQSYGAILFAPDINELPLSKTFSFLYAPTIIAVSYGFIWSWIDLDVKRLEPYYQLCSTHNTTAENSLLLHYPFDFIATVPYRALKNRHWPVFSVSLVIVVTFWAVTPLQSGIFATENRTLSSTVPMLSSTSYLPIGKQTNLTSVYAQHVANIAWLNETLPSYMTRDAILSPFAPAEHSDFEKNETWFGSTRLFSVDVTCEQAVFIDTDFGGVYNGTNGCSYEAPPLIAPDSNDSTKYLDTIYVGYQDENGFAEYYLSSACPQNQSHTFFVRMASVSGRTIRNHTLEYATALPEQGNSTALYCEPRYYSQLGNATVSAGGQEVLAFVPTGDKEPLPQGMFDIDAFEWNMNSAQTQDYDARGDFPTTAWPDQMSHFLDTHLDLNYFPKMCAFALACYQRPLEDYLDPVILARSYEAAYRLLFARQMADILQPNYKGAVQVAGTRTFEAQGVVLVPTFTYIVTALLGINIIFASWLLYFAVTRSLNLASNPSTIASMMSQVADDIHIQKLFSALDRSSEDELAQKLGSARFVLGADQPGQIRLQISESVPNITKVPDYTNSTLGLVDTESGIRPRELRWYSGTTFLALQLICFVILAVLQNWAARENGIPLPSEHTVVRQLVENYVPMAIGTFIEPFWLVINRLLCVLQPFEELRRGDTMAIRSIALDYHSLPPQFTVWKAFRARHFVLAAVCLMSMLANGLSVAFGGLFYEDSVGKSTTSTFSPLLALRMQALNGTGPPFNSGMYPSWQGGTTRDEFYIAMSNMTTGSKLPPWTDNSLFYLPVSLPKSQDTATTFGVVTAAFGSELICEELSTSGSNRYYRTADIKFGVSLIYNDTASVNCSDPTGSLIVSDTTHNIGAVLGLDGALGHSAFEFSLALGGNTNHSDLESAFCREHIVAGWTRGIIKNASLLVSESQTTLLCRPKLVSGQAEVVVDENGYIISSKRRNVSSDAIDAIFTTSSTDLISQAHQFILDSGTTWHNDSFPSDFMNYLMEKMANTSRYLDPGTPLPLAGEVAPLFAALYNKLFAILLGNNKNSLFLKAPSDSKALSGAMTNVETRIFVSSPAFIVSEVILGLYMITTLFLYLRRPWPILTRLPTTIASMVAFFAASHAIQQFRGTAGLTAIQRTQWLEDMRQKWAFGTFVGTDGRVHVGVERQPLVTRLQAGKLPKTTAPKEQR